MSTRTDSTFGTLGERTRSAGPGSASGSAPRGGPGRARHVVVDGRHPGVLMAWSRVPSGWLGEVAYVEGERLVVAWLDAARLRPA